MRTRHNITTQEEHPTYAILPVTSISISYSKAQKCTTNKKPKIWTFVVLAFFLKN